MQINKRFDLLKKLTMSGRPRRPILAVRAGRKPSPDDRAFPQPNLQDEEGDNNDLLDREFENSIHYFLRKLGRFLKSNWKIFLYAVVCIFLGQFMFERKCEKTEVEQNSQCFLAIEKNLSWREAIYSYGSSLTEAQIRFEGQKCMYLAIAGHVFDVSSAKQTYQRGSDYNAFIGIDGTRAFGTEKLNKQDFTSEVGDLSHAQIKRIEKWINFYWIHENYNFVGVVRGPFFYSNGKPTANLNEMLQRMDKTVS